MARDRFRNLRKRADGRGQHDEIGVFHAGGEIVMHGIDNAGLFGALHDLRRVRVAGNMASQSRAAHAMGHGRADEADAHQGNAIEMWRRAHDFTKSLNTLSVSRLASSVPMVRRRQLCKP